MSSHSKNPTADRLLELSNEANRIAVSLARLSTGPVGPKVQPEKVLTGGEEAKITADEIGAVINRRRRRSAYLPQVLFADPAWDILLELFRAEAMQSRESVSGVSAAAGVPTTTGVRWLTALEKMGLVARRADPIDGRRIFVELTPDASAALRRWYADSFREVLE